MTKSGFANPDAFENVTRLIAYLDRVGSLDFIRLAKEFSYKALRIQPGDQVLDVGCGLGDDVAAMSELVGLNGHVLGLDLSEILLSEARKRHKLCEFYTFQKGDVMSLSFPDNAFHAVRAERSLLHVKDPAVAIKEMVRVTKPKGRIAIADVAWETLVINAANHNITKRVREFIAEIATNGRYITTAPEILDELNCCELIVQPVTPVLNDYVSFLRVQDLSVVLNMMTTNGALSPAEAQTWFEDFRGREPFVASLTMFVVGAQKRA